MIHFYYGDGKGKTTAALGLTMRAAGHGWQVVIVQFLKSQPTGELVILDQLDNVQVLRGKEGQGFTFQMTEEELRQTAIRHHDNLQKAIELVRSGQCDLLVLDEVAVAYQQGLLDQKLLLDFLADQSQRVEVVLTGRPAIPELLALADYVTEVKKIKHPYDSGVAARMGIEY